MLFWGPPSIQWENGSPLCFAVLFPQAVTFWRVLKRDHALLSPVFYHEADCGVQGHWTGWAESGGCGYT